MGKIAFLYEKEDTKIVFAVCQSLLEQKGHEVNLFLYNDKNTDAIFKANSEKYDLLVCPNLVAYDIQTLTGGRSLNMATYKVYHLITEEHCKNEKYLANIISIAHFFYCTKESQMKKFKEKYPHIPYLRLLENWEESAETNGAVLNDSICDVLKMCYID